jgi:hypothetical protein
MSIYSRFLFVFVLLDDLRCIWAALVACFLTGVDWICLAFSGAGLDEEN